MEIRDLQKLCHKMAVEKGFWEDKEHNIPEKLMLIVTELGEACEALRKGKRQISQKDYDNLKPHETSPGSGVMIGGFKFPRWNKDTFEDEVADIYIRLGDLCEHMKIDIEWQIKNKMKYNSKRPYKHGKEF